MQDLPNFSFEGDDGTGKLTATLATIAQLLSNTDHNILFVTHPNYFASGQLIKGMNRKKADPVFAGLSPVELTELRCAAYALDRAFTMIMTHPWLKHDPNTLVIADRGPHSNAVTVGVMLGKEIISESEAADLIDNFIPRLEPELSQLLSFEPVLCCTENVNHTAIGVDGRMALDDYESMQDRNPISWSYKRLIEAEPLITRSNRVWRRPYEIADELLQRYGLSIGQTPRLSPAYVLREYRESGRFWAVGPDVFIATVFGPDVKSFISNELRQKCDQWFHSIIMEPADLSQAKDSILDQLEREISYLILDLANEYPVLNSNISPFASQAIKRLLDTYPKLIDVVSYSLEGKATGLMDLILQIGALSTEQ